MRYARIDTDGRVAEVVLPAFDEGGNEIDISLRFHPDFVALLVEIPGDLPVVEGYTYLNGVFSAPVPPVIPPEYLAMEARLRRESLLRTVYDPGIMMALRAVRTSTSEEQTAYAETKVAELDQYAELLLAIPDQPGFPQTIVWPVVPTK